ncbi:MAG: DNA mismatch repair protein MutT [Candidatus Magasanikbacteria bacterium RIFCSPHIGHO2_01_FULL_41_23]|uniref:DNA mismatch repair protein MutT n=1 Tax=Candidatus Magasanikbacteria bacterium RIFCSPLOWO2_01_FULL_40_15 TaxID=1798686 RepID=A0A1F6N0K6_9BACT|nr:MAG: DNA mismatch repair protein MutT [Candidatus Magasanikbacteria bacterium RIFCSPHIGHO2_01_FULL_41_23]OGH74746.1 MAG: DNA mismatch repair protein MutT [Candidatus Magasanikbacteria bacterium RIFCSPHIGHO2_12_FULL_41_16]OGH77459.1 MAG: DNA mismatch repair protein MutT [Candidatus Magasanikbacteria bacterium RIFCSPLOWO2_01_FULL_40_15]
MNTEQQLKRPKVGLGVIIVKDSKVLLGQRKNAHGNGTWGFPGGHLEFGESYEDCAKRETMEEVGITIKNIRFITATNDVFETEDKHYITIYVVADYDAGEVVNMEPQKLECWNWFAWDELPQPLFLPIQNLIKTGFRP